MQVGTWRRTVKRTKVDVAVTPLVALSTRDRTVADSAFRSYGHFLGLPCSVTRTA
ncbi:MAG: hypothetical protein IRY85_22500 [Micromonosporaceae bacterium]|nr:hypothetical protein [Micromonosporaceae bacterium]